MALCAAVLPVWARHLATSRTQSESAVQEMLAAFTEIGPHLDLAARQSHQITLALAQGEGGITQLAQACEAELQPCLAGLDAPTTAALGRVMNMIKESVTALEQVARPFEHETQMVGKQVERMYMGLQYQDRISQMVTLLHEDMLRLHALVVDSGLQAQALDSGAWLERLESQYAMAEQRQDHSGQTGVAGDDIETTFF
jgi:hypothetical protein